MQASDYFQQNQANSSNRIFPSYNMSQQQKLSTRPPRNVAPQAGLLSNTTTYRPQHQQHTSQQHNRHQNNHNHQILLNSRINHHSHNPHAPMGYMRSIPHDGDLPLRILVQSDMVGAIIGRSGTTIRQIIQETRARIDVHREDCLDHQDKVITIHGSPESCSDACFKIMDIVLNEKINNRQHSNPDFNEDNSLGSQQEDNSNPVIQLKLLAHNNLIGRLIGRKGASIKEIMEQTSTKINISTNSLTDSTQENTISVTGYLDRVRQAESLISLKLRASHSADMNTIQSMSQQSYLFNNMPYLSGPYSQNPILTSLVGSSGAPTGTQMGRGIPVNRNQAQMASSIYGAPTNYLPIYPNVPVSQSGRIGYNPVMSGAEFEKETVNIHIPNGMVGAIIGKSGSAIKGMISSSGAIIKVAAALPNDKTSQLSRNSDSKDENCDTQKDKSDIDVAPAQDEEPDKTPTESQTHSGLNNQQNSQSHVSQNDSNIITRKVTIVGSPESQCTAQFLIYRKVSAESGINDVSLMVEIQVPSQFVGKIIGKGGSTVRQIQMSTRTTIRLPDDKPSPTVQNSENGTPPTEQTLTTVQITGDFQGSQLAQRQIRSLIRESQYSASHRQHMSNKHQNNNNNNNNSNNNNTIGGKANEPTSPDIQNSSNNNGQNQCSNCDTTNTTSTTIEEESFGEREIISDKNEEVHTRNESPNNHNTNDLNDSNCPPRNKSQ